MTFHKKDSCRRAQTAAIAFTALLLLLLPAIIGIVEKSDDDNNIMALPLASAQSIVPESSNQNTNISGVQNASSSSSLLFRGLIGSMIPTEQNANSTTTNAIGVQQVNQSDYTVAGKWRLLVNESLVQRFVANLTVARTDGSEYHNNIIIENIGRPSEFVGNASSVLTQISTNTTSPGAIVPIRLEVKDKVLQIADIDIDEGRVEDEEQQNILTIIDGQSIYGIVEFQGTG